MVFDAFKDKINHFNPAFHSMTPEGLNSRLTFLQQCTRQGPTLEKVDTKNLAFGRAPVCILRIGDFYHTKIVIDSLNIDYEPLIWDLNPEGIGVQPMLANVTLSFKFVGGSSLQGPINILQNALSFNYYANTQVYDPRASYIKEGKVVVGATTLTSYTATDNQTTTEPKPELDQGAAAEKATGPEVLPVATVAVSDTSGYTNTEIQSFLGIVSVKYTKDNVLGDYDITVTLRFEENTKVKDFILKDTITAKLYILSDVGKNQKAFGDLKMYQNGTGSDTVVVENNVLGGGSSPDSQLIYSYSGNKYGNSANRNNIVLQYNIDDDEVIQFIDEGLKKPSPTLKIIWGTGGAVSNCAFPYP